jgi:hypothetical protein
MLLSSGAASSAKTSEHEWSLHAARDTGVAILRRAECTFRGMGRADVGATTRATPRLIVTYYKVSHAPASPKQKPGRRTTLLRTQFGNFIAPQIDRLNRSRPQRTVG